jgi:uncharacterized protein with GYD domain
MGDLPGEVGSEKGGLPMRVRPKDVVKDEVTYFYLISDTKKGAAQSAAARKKDINGVNAAVKKEGGQCSLYLTRGGTHDFISVITGISAAAAVRIAAEIESRGTVKATLISGLELFYAP